MSWSGTKIVEESILASFNVPLRMNAMQVNDPIRDSEAPSLKVLELMKSHVIKTTPDALIQEAVDMMDLYQISGLPVVDSSDLVVGIITEYDIIHALLPQFSEAHAEPAESERRQNFPALVRKIKHKTVSEVMSSPVFSVDENADVLEAVKVMLAHRIKRLPVTSEGRLVGVISRIDICQAMLEGQI
jgi:CBS domain-containing protein